MRCKSRDRSSRCFVRGGCDAWKREALEEQLTNRPDHKALRFQRPGTSRLTTLPSHARPVPASEVHRRDFAEKLLRAKVASSSQSRLLFTARCPTSSQQVMLALVEDNTEALRCIEALQLLLIVVVVGVRDASCWSVSRGAAPTLRMQTAQASQGSETPEAASLEVLSAQQSVTRQRLQVT